MSDAMSKHTIDTHTVSVPCIKALRSACVVVLIAGPEACAARMCGAWQAQRYAALRKPYLINDMAMQDVLLDRRRVYQKLQVCA